MKASIIPVSFGDKSLIARSLTAKGSEVKASIIESAVLPIVSNAACGHSTFANIISGKSHNTKCPLQAALWGLLHTATGKPAYTKPANAIRAAFATIDKADEQESHDAIIGEACGAIGMVFIVAPTDKAKATDWKALAASLQARIDALEIDKAELTSHCQELQARIDATVPASVPATV